MAARPRDRHPRTLLPAAAREPLARGRRGAGLGRPVPRLERAHHRGVLRAQHRRPPRRRRQPHPRHRQQLRAHLVQRRADAARLAGAAGARRGAGHRGGRPRQRGRPRRPRQRARPGLQPQIMPLATPARQGHAGALGPRGLPRAASAASPRGCGCRRRRSTTRRWRCWPRRASGSRSWRRPRPGACGRSAADDVGRGRRRASIPAAPISGAARAGCRSRCSSTTGPSRARSPSSACSSAARRFAAPAARGLLRRARLAAARALRHRRRVLRPPQPLRRDGAGLGPASSSTRTTPSRLTNYGAFLAAHPPTHEAQIHQRTSWSCAHGVERWRADCGCRVRGDWHQRWRGPLREALDWLRDLVDPFYEARAGRPLRDPWAARDDYVRVVLDRRPERSDAFLAAPQRGAARRRRAGWRSRRLLELQRNRLLMYTSCGWFFDEISGHRAGADPPLRGDGAAVPARPRRRPPRARVRQARWRRRPSNVADFGDGAEVYRRLVTPAVVDLRRVVAHYAITGLFDGAPGRRRRLRLPRARLDEAREASGGTALRIAHVRVESRDHRRDAGGDVRAAALRRPRLRPARCGPGRVTPPTTG